MMRDVRYFIHAKKQLDDNEGKDGLMNRFC